MFYLTKINYLSIECFCSDYYGKYGLAVNQSECNMPCGGNRNQICGNNARNSIYEIKGKQTSK